ncbi:MAG TPA: hypothetical protein PLS03_13925 [Terrimicrobiaceae bacterium]|nr:hypothetical protein [Terrimicrobiaceae bacterium]
MKNPAETNPESLRVIKTARNKTAINKAAKDGYRPLVKKLERLEKINAKFAVYQNPATGEIREACDYRAFPEEGFVEVIEWTRYYPHFFSSPYAAYLIPKDIMVGECVFLEDLIEDLVGSTWNQGDCFRLESCEAVWNGTEFEIQYNPETQRLDTVG